MSISIERRACATTRLPVRRTPYELSGFAKLAPTNYEFSKKFAHNSLPIFQRISSVT